MCDEICKPKKKPNRIKLDTLPTMTKLRIAVQGCCHGELDNIYTTITRMNSTKKIDLLIILGDFQSIRNSKDLGSISIPPKYQKLGDFGKYYSGESVPPVPTIFIGGNHESMRHLMQLPYGGYAAENIYYLGYSDVIWYRGIRIGSLSGIWKQWDVNKKRPTWESLEANGWRSNIRSLYHVRKTDLIPLFMIEKEMDLMLSHDWPNEVVYYGDVSQLLKKKPFFEKDINNKELGSPVNWELLKHIKPKWWLSAHLHVKYEATVNHNQEDKVPQVKNNDEIILDLLSDDEENNLKSKNKDEIDLDLSSYTEDKSTVSKNEEEIDLGLDLDSKQTFNVKEKKRNNTKTNFLALDKCLPRRQWLEIIDVDTDITHPSWYNNQMYWDSEYIGNLQYMAKFKDQILNTPLNDLNWKQMIYDRKLYTENNKNNVDYKDDKYAIPLYSEGIQFKEKEQTALFEEKFLKD